MRCDTLDNSGAVSGHAEATALTATWIWVRLLPVLFLLLLCLLLRL